jgi:DNA-binding NarL/FixJ family response regulator
MLAYETIKVQVVYGDALVAAGLAATLRDRRDIGLLAATAVDDKMPGAGLRSQVDVVVADYEQGMSILASARGDSWCRQSPLPTVLIVSQRDTESEIRYALEQGARGFLLLGCSVDELVDAVHALRAGLRHIGARAAQRLADSLSYEALTGREQAVLRLVVEGLGNKAIANRLDIAIGTVKSHLKSIFQKLNAGSRTEVATVAERRGLLMSTTEHPGHRENTANGRFGGTAHQPSTRVDRHRPPSPGMSEKRVLAAH